MVGGTGKTIKYIIEAEGPEEAMKKMEIINWKIAQDQPLFFFPKGDKK